MKMDGMYLHLLDFLKKPASFEAFVDIVLCAVPIWVAIMIGLMIGWSWRPRWTGLVFLGLRSKFKFLCVVPPGLGARRLWLTFTAFSAFSICNRICTNFKWKNEASTIIDSSASSLMQNAERSCKESSEKEKNIVAEKDLEHLRYLLEGKFGEGMWQNIMEISTSNMTYQAWRYEPEVGPTMYRSRTVFEDVTPELVRDFFWDDTFRPKWDPMLASSKVLEEDPSTGMMTIHWIKKFPFFCGDREYIICRRIWESGRTFYCVTKGVPYPGLPKRTKPLRVELYFSGWIIKPVKSRKADGQLTACEATLVHYEDMGIPKDVAKIGVRHGMWGAVKKLQSGIRTYQLARNSEGSISHCSMLARVTTKLPYESSPTFNERVECKDEKNQPIDSKRNENQSHPWKWVLIGGTMALVCGLHTGIIRKALLLGSTRRSTQR